MVRLVFVHFVHGCGTSSGGNHGNVRQVFLLDSSHLHPSPHARDAGCATHPYLSEIDLRFEQIVVVFNAR